MFINPSLYLASLVFCLPIYWLLFKNDAVSRGIFLSVFSLALIGLLLPALVPLTILSSAIAYGYKFVCKTYPSKTVAAIAGALQLLIMWLPDLTDLDKITLGMALVGLAYFTLRNIGVIIDIYKGKISPSFLDIVFLNTFFPTYSAGPVENLKTLNVNSCNATFDTSEFLVGIARVLLGILKFYFLSAVLLVPILGEFPPTAESAILEADAFTIVTAILFSWLQLYAAFSGYSDIAIGSSKLFGIRVRENFNSPFLARNIQEFWQRWNISIMNFVSEYFYLNFVRVTGRRVFGIFLAFFVMGMWHHLSWNYLIWAFAHGGAMALFMVFRRSKASVIVSDLKSNNRGFNFIWVSLSRVITIFFVSLASAIATAPDLETGLAYIGTFFG